MRSTSNPTSHCAVLVSLAVLWIGSAHVLADEGLLAPGDLILAIDTDIISQSSYPTGGNDERPAMLLDGTSTTKYLNFGKEFSGFIVTPARGPTTVRSMVLTTANDAEERDPDSYQIFGTNATIASTNNSNGTAESWTLISEGSLSLPADRLTAGPLVSFTNESAYASYKVVFPLIKNTATANSMQLADVALRETPDDTGVNILAVGDVILAVDADSPSSYPVPSENPQNILDGMISSKYLNFGQENSGFIVTPAAGAAAVRSFVVYTANDYEERDPTSFAIYGTNDPIASVDNSAGTAENWALIATGPLSLPVTRFTAAPLASFENSTAYSSYKVLFPTLKNVVGGVATDANSMQISEVMMYEAADGTGPNLLGSGGTVLAVDPDGMSESSYLAAQSPPQAIDGSVETKYANAGGVNSGFIVTPSVGLSLVTSFKLTTADTAMENDPAAWKLYGTTDPITSVDNSSGDAETWTLIASGDVALPEARTVEGPVVSFANTALYNSYKLVFTALRDEAAALAMQFAEVQFFGTIASAIPDPLLSPGDFIIAFDLDPDGSNSNYPAAENPANVLDNNTATKYLNFAGANSGIIVTPAAGPSIIGSMRLSTANDAPERDPASYEVYGTNEALVSTNNSPGNAENWSLIASGTVALPDLRFDAQTVVSFAGNSTAYRSYKVLFPTLKGAATMMQIADVALYATTDGTGARVTAVGDSILAVDADILPSSSYPANESPANAIDRIITNATGGSSKYLNFGKANAGFIVRPSIGSSVVTSFKMVTANDSPERDPAGWELYGTTDEIISPDNSHGNLENWILVASGTMALPDTRHAAGPVVSFPNTTDYTAYRMVFTTLKNTATANSFQFAEVQFYGKIGVSCATPYADLDGDADVDQDDFGVAQACFTGPYGAATTRICRCLDKGKDGLVDSDDIALFTNCVTGPAIPWSQELAPSCSP